MTSSSSPLDQTLTEAIAIFRPSALLSHEELLEQPDAQADDLIKQYQSDAKASLKRVCEVSEKVYDAYQSGSISPGVYETLFKRASDQEAEVISWAYSGESEDIGFDFFPVYSSNVANDLESGLGSSVGFFNRLIKY